MRHLPFVGSKDDIDVIIEICQDAACSYLVSGSMYPGTYAKRTPDKAAIVCSTEERMTYGELERTSDALARAWRARGIVAGDVVALVMANSPAFFAVAWAAQRSGLYYVAISTYATSDELAYLLEDCEAKSVVADGSFADAVREALDRIARRVRPYAVARGIGVPGFDDLDELVANASGATYEPIEGSDMLYTSGTTGRPKGVKPMLGGQPLGTDRRRTERARELYGFDERTVFLIPAPAYHAAPLRFGMTALRFGATVVLLPKFEPKAALDALARFDVTHSQWVPTMFRRMLELPEDVRAKWSFPAHRLAMHSGASCAIDVKRRMIAWWGPILYEYYSGSESVGFTHADSVEWLAHPGTVGRPYGCSVHVLDDAGNERSAGETGTIYFESTHALAYHNDPEKTRDALDNRGWATMGDLGYVDDDGYLFLTDRRAFTIVTGGVNVYPREIETVLETHPDVREAAVFGLPDEDFGERVHAVVAVAAARRADPTLAPELLRYTRARLSAYKVPKRLDVREELPHVGAGKLDKRGLRRQYLDVAANDSSEEIT